MNNWNREYAHRRYRRRPRRSPRPDYYGGDFSAPARLTPWERQPLSPFVRFLIVFALMVLGFICSVPCLAVATMFFNWAS